MVSCMVCEWWQCTCPLRWVDVVKEVRERLGDWGLGSSPPTKIHRWIELPSSSNPLRLPHAHAPASSLPPSRTFRCLLLLLPAAPAPAPRASCCDSFVPT